MIVEIAGRSWEWPDADVKCRRAMDREVGSLRQAYRHLKGSRTAIQAGGNMGVYPGAMARHFSQVITAEPDSTCFGFLCKNVADENVRKFNIAFGEHHGKAGLTYPHGNNLGTQHLSPGTGVEVVPIDSLGITDCDLLHLDVEGAELLALKGAAATIALSRPAICVEENGLCSRYGYKDGELSAWLASMFGYRKVASFNRDVLYTCA